jgi:hypothetical protein
MFCWVIASILCARVVLELLAPRSAAERGCRLNGPGEEHAKTTAAATPAGHPHAATVRQNDRLADGQTKAITGHTRLRRRAQAKEGLENAVAVFHRDTWSFVVDHELQFSVGGGPSPHTNWGARWRVFDRVLEQIGQHALYLARIHTHDRQAWRYLPPHGSLANDAPDPVQCTVHNANRIGECQIRIR